MPVVSFYDRTREHPATEENLAMYITDITHFLDKNMLLPKDLSPEARDFAEFLGSIISTVTYNQTCDVLDTKICCRLPEKPPCTGTIHACIDGDYDKINWICPRCKVEGDISNWHNTFWDVSDDRSLT